MIIRLFLFFTVSSLILQSNILFAQDSGEGVLVELADEMFEFGDFEDALGLYLQATFDNPQNVRAHYMAGRCYLRTTSEKPESVEYFKKAYELNPAVSNRIFFQIAEGYRFGGEFDDAIIYYNKYKHELETDRRAFAGMDVDEEINKAERRIKASENAKVFIQNPVNVNITNLGSTVNSVYQDYAPQVSQDGNTLIFTSKRSGTTGGLKDNTNNFYEDIWISVKKDGEWTTPENMGEPVNSTFHDSNIGLSPDGNILYIYKNEGRGDIYYSERKNGEWKKPKPLKEINTEHKELSVNHTVDGKLYFASGRPGGPGGTDIYVSIKDKKGNWGDP
jgi:predicted transcriptional regulator YdeE